MVQSAIHIGKEELFAGLEDLEGWTTLDDGLSGAVAGSTQIDILGGYYTSKNLIKILKSGPRIDRKNCAVRIAVGLDASVKMAQVWRDMQDIRSELRKAGYRDVTAFIVTGRWHFHTKLFHFLRTTQHTWLVGSANPGSERHELMVALRGKHDALTGYLKAVFKQAVEVTDDKPKKQPIVDIRDFFLSGALLHTPPRYPQFTFDAFRLQPSDRDKITKAMAVAIDVPHASPTTQGFSFSLRSAAGVDVGDTDADEADNISVRHLSVDTVLGRWVPSPYASELYRQVQDEESRRRGELARFAQKVIGPGEQAVYDAFRHYLVEMERFLNQYQLDIPPVANREMLFKSFLKSRQKLLTDETSRERLAKRMHLTSMPDIWTGATSAREFESSFFEDVAYRASQARRPRIVSSIMDAIDDEGEFLLASEIRKKVVRRIERASWTTDLWQMGKEQSPPPVSGKNATGA